MDNRKFIDQAKSIVLAYYKSIGVDLTEDNIYITWLTKVLGNNKALLASDTDDSKYFELTYYGDKDEYYLDIYDKLDNQVIR